MDLSEALSILPFASLPPTVITANKRPSTRTTICSPSAPPPALRGVAFRHVNSQVEAIFIRAPTLPAASGDEEAINVEGGEISIIGAYNLTKSVIRLACSSDGRLLLLACGDGSLTCLNVLCATNDSVQFTPRWESSVTSLNNMHGLHYDISFNPDGSVMERRWSEDENCGSVKIHSLEFVLYSFLMVVELDGETRVLWMDGSAEDSPSMNYWDLDVDVASDGAVTCATACPTQDNSLVIALGTNKGKLGMLQTSSSGKTVRFVDHTLEQEPDEPSWQVSHLNWFAPHKLAVGFTRVIVEEDPEEDEEEDDPNEHQANLLIGNLSNGSPLDSSSWEWQEMGDVVPFFSVPKGGHHVFHTAALPSMMPTPSSLLLVGCNVGSDVIPLSKEDGAWTILDLIEGQQLTCPTDEDDEFLYLMGLAVMMLSVEEEQKWYPFPLLSSTGGGVSGFAPYHRGIGQEYFATVSVDGGVSQSINELAVPVALSDKLLSLLPSASASNVQATEGKDAADETGGCILSGLDLGLDELENKQSVPSLERFDEDLSQDESNSDDSAGEDSLDSSSNQSDKKPEAQPATSAFVSGFSAPAFSFSKASFSFQPSAATAASTSPMKSTISSNIGVGGFSFGTTGAATFGSPSATFGSPSTLGGYSSSTKPKGTESSATPAIGSSTSGGTVFGSSTSGGFVSFGSIKASSNMQGFGNKNDETQEETHTVSTPAFGSGKEAPTLSFGTPVGGGNIATSNLGSNQFGTFGKGADKATPSKVHEPQLPKSTSGNSPSTVTAGEAAASELLQTVLGKKASQVFTTVLSECVGDKSYIDASDFAKLVDEIGEGFHGDELDNQLSLVDPSNSGKIDRDAFVNWYCNLVNKDDDDESSNDEEVAEERANAEKAFVALAGDGKDTILAADFCKLIESMGTTYCEEEHRRTTKKISTTDASTGGSVITKKSFVDWYVDWLFGDGDSDSEEEEDAVEDKDEPIATSEIKSEGWGSAFKASEEGSWKCEVCMVMNEPSASACAACETAKPGEEAKVKVSDAGGSKSVPAASGAISAGGFTFGSTAAPAGSGIGAGGFSFAVTQPATAASASGQTSGSFTGGFTFAAPSSTKEDTTKIDEKPTSSVAAFPPMSKSAPKPFGIPKNDETKSASSSTASFPLSAAAPKPFSLASPTISSVAAFPPMSASAPKPFGVSTTTKEIGTNEKKSSSGAAFPPMSASAPKPFSTAAPKPSSGAAFPPMSASAPIPFGVSTATKEIGINEKKSPFGAAFPPMSASAPKPFSTAAPKPSSGAAFPPMSASAPKPFGVSTTTEEPNKNVKSPFGAAFPPMSASAPKPFTSVAPKPTFGVPSVSSASPTPFSSFGAKKSDPSSGFGFPVTTTAAPTPFSSFTATKTDLPSTAAFPPMSTSAPKPFGGGEIKKEDIKQSTSSAAFPPMSASAPKPFSSATPKPSTFSPSPSIVLTPKSFGAPAATKEDTAPSANLGAVPMPSADLPYTVSSKYEKQLWDQVSQFSKLTRDAKNLQSELKAVISPEFESDIKEVASKCQEHLSNASSFSQEHADAKERLVYMLSVHDDLSRQNKVSTNSINDQVAKKSLTLIARKEPLDAESQMKRQTILSKCHKVQSLLEMSEQCLSLNKEVFTLSSKHLKPMRPSEYFNQISSPKPSSHQQTVKSANSAILLLLKQQYERCRDVSVRSESLKQSVTRLSDAHPNRRQISELSAKKTQRITSARKSISPLPTKHIASLLSSTKKSRVVNAVSTLESHDVLRSFASEISRRKHSNTHYLRSASSRPATIPDWKSKGKNELLPASRKQERQNHHSSPVVRSLFSSPVASSQRWKRTSTQSSTTLQVNIPTNLKEINASDAAKSALAKFGTTPETLAQGRELLQRDRTESSTAKKSPKPGLTSGASLPPEHSSQGLNLQTKSSSTDESASIENDINYLRLLKTFLDKHAPEKVPDVEQYLKKYSGKEAEMFAGLARKYDAPNALNEVFLSRVGKIDAKDYSALFTLYLTVFNPSRVSNVQEYLNRYKGKEKEVFDQLSKKYCAFNPLESVGEKEKEVFDQLSKKYCAINPLESVGEGDQTPKPQDTSSSFPPMSVTAPSNPFGVGKPETSKNAKSQTASFPPMSSSAPKPVGLFGQLKSKSSKPTDTPKTESEASKTTESMGFGGMFSSLPSASSSPFGGPPASSNVAKADSIGASDEKDYHKILTEFYKQHNSAKVSEVTQTLTKYKGNEVQLFQKLAQKYKTTNPLDNTTTKPTPFGGFGSSLPGADKPTDSFGSSAVPQTTPSGGEDEGKSKTPFSSFGIQTSSNTPFDSKSPFGSSNTPAPSVSPFGSTAAGFGTTGTANFSSTPVLSTGFGSTPFSSTPAAQTTGAAPKFGGQHPRDILVSFYETYNPSKIQEVDKNLAKYAGNEEQLFRNLAKKYNVDPAQFGVCAQAPASQNATGFGNTSAPTFGSQQGFGTPSFGSPGVLGGGAHTGGGFGSNSGGFGSSGGVFGSTGGSSAGVSTFGSLAASSGSGFGSQGNTGFGSQTPFGAARR